MAYSYSSTTLSTYESYLAADKPIVAHQTIRTSPASVIWHNSGGTTDRTDSSYPARRGYDGNPGLVTKPTAVSPDTTWYYSISHTSAINFDLCGIVGHNFGTLHADGALTITLEVDDLSDFSTCVSIPITVTTSTSNTRIMQLSLKHTGGDALRYSSVNYVRLKITRASTNFTPEIGEIVLGYRLQMYHKPDVPYDSYRKLSRSEQTITEGGVIYNAVYSKGARVLDATWRTDNTTLQSNISNFASGSYHLTRPFVWIENPYSAPNTWYYMVPTNSEFELPLVENPYIREFHLEAIEQGPEGYYIVTGTY